jgi:hypothetical protein
MTTGGAKLAHFSMQRTVSAISTFCHVRSRRALDHPFSQVIHGLGRRGEA